MREKGLAGLALAAACATGSARAQVVQDVPVVAAMSAYVEPSGLVEVAPGRRIHIRCQGTGAPTVIFTAGLGAWSGSWALVQPQVAKITQTCAWDRAGFGLSDGDETTAQTASRTTDDLERALKAAGVPGPYVMVGHSAGAHETLTFVDRHRDLVAGVVLVDPVRPHDMAREAAAGPKATALDRAYYAGETKRLRDCARGIETGAVKAGTPGAPCFQYFPEIPPDAQAVLARRDAEPARLRTQASLFEEYEPNGERVVRDDRDYGDLPLIVVSADPAKVSGLWPEAAKDEHAALIADWVGSHLELKALSRRGERRIADGAGHLVQLQNPQAVIDAVLDVVKAARTDRRR